MPSQAAETKLTRAKTSLILSQPFFATLVFKLEFKEDNSQPHAWTDGETLGYNAAWIAGLSVDQTAGLLAHEVLHLACLHHTRREGREPDAWNKAADYAINGELKKAGFILPPDGLYSAKYDGLSAEDIYRKEGEKNCNQKKKQNQGNGQPDPNGQPGPGEQSPPGEVRDSPGKTQAETREAEAKQQQAIQQALNVAKSAGAMPGDMERLITEAQPPAVDWRDVLARFVEQTAKSDYSFTRPNTRYSGTGFFMPGLKSESMPPLAVAVDVSGSIKDEELNQFGAEIQAIADTWKPEKIKVIYCNTEITNRQKFEPGDEIKLEAKGGGGTSFAPVMDEIRDDPDQPAALIYLTDLCVFSMDRYGHDPGPPVLWIATQRHHNPPPFGEVVTMY